MVDLLSPRPPFLSHWPTDADYLMCVDESGDRGLTGVDKNWPLLSIFGAIFSKDAFFEVQRKTNALKSELWPPDGTFLYEVRGQVVKRKVCFHSREMRQKTGPFSSRYLDDDKRAHMDRVLWDDIISTIQWHGISCIIDKAELLRQYSFPKDPYDLAITFILERFVMNFSGRLAVLFEARGLEEDTALWKTTKDIMTHGTEYLDARRFKRKIFDFGWHPKFNEQGKVVCGLEIADLCSYCMGAHYHRGGNRFAEKVIPKLLYYDPADPKAIWGKGYKVFPKR